MERNYIYNTIRDGENITLTPKGEHKESLIWVNVIK